MKQELNQTQGIEKVLRYQHTPQLGQTTTISTISRWKAIL